MGPVVISKRGVLVAYNFAKVEGAVRLRSLAMSEIEVFQDEPHDSRCVDLKHISNPSGSGEFWEWARKQPPGDYTFTNPKGEPVVLVVIDEDRSVILLDIRRIALMDL